eukprot:6372743-Lingulodinium_polyedra.AAC.1
MERVQRGDLPEWKDEKRSGPGRDPRVCALQRGNAMKRVATLRGLAENREGGRLALPGPQGD